MTKKNIISVLIFTIVCISCINKEKEIMAVENYEENIIKKINNFFNIYCKYAASLTSIPEWLSRPTEKT